MTPHPGDLLASRYRLTELIAIGGMGQVWQARDEMLSRDVAVKILRPELARQAGFLARFRVEARHAARVSHANVAQIYDYGEIHDDGADAPATSAFLVMELVPGEPLSAILADEGRLDPERVLDLIAQAGSGLGAAHATGVVHRDVKPGNLMVTPDGLIKITDFGVAVAKGDASLTETGQVMGTAQYLAPEQAVGEEVTPASDIYALGVVAYQCLAGTLPFPRDSALATALAHVHDQVPDLPDSVPPATSGLIYAMVRKEPDSRPATGRDVAAAANSILAGFTPALTSTGSTPTQAFRSVAASGAPVTTGQSVLPGRATRRTLRLPLAALVALVALLVALTVSQGFNPSQDTDDLAPEPTSTPTGPASTRPASAPGRTTVTVAPTAPSQPDLPAPGQTQVPTRDPSPTEDDGNATGVLNAPVPTTVVGQTTVTTAPSSALAWTPGAPLLLPSPTLAPSDDIDPTPSRGL